MPIQWHTAFPGLLLSPFILKQVWTRQKKKMLSTTALHEMYNFIYLNFKFEA